jgi:aminoglycoside phosphotransferase (APT) family kinase protein
MKAISDSRRRILSRLDTFSSADLEIDPLRLDHYDDNSYLVRDRSKADSAYKVRFSSTANPASVENEHAALCLLFDAGKSWAPRVVEYKPEVPLLVTTFIEGKSLDKLLVWKNKSDMIQNGLQSVINDVHTIHGTCFGQLYGDKYESWLELMSHRFWDYVATMKRLSVLGVQEIRLIRAVYNRSSVEFSIVKPTLLHFDVKPANIVVNEEKGSIHLIDFELARFGDVDFEWAKMYFLSRCSGKFRRLVAAEVIEQAHLTFLRPKIVIYMLYAALALISYEQKFRVKTPYKPLPFLRALLRLARHSGAR